MKEQARARYSLTEMNLGSHFGFHSRLGPNDGDPLTLGLNEGTNEGPLLNDEDALGITLGAPLADGEELGPNDGAPLTLGLNEGTI
jgi:hypothetical protein